MIGAEFFTNSDGEILGFCIKGHADTDDYGKDILCAAVSSAACMAVNTITEIIGVKADVLQKSGFISVMLSECESYRCRETLRGLKIHLLCLEEQYPENIKVNYTEV